MKRVTPVASDVGDEPVEQAISNLTVSPGVPDAWDDGARRGVGGGGRISYPFRLAGQDLSAKVQVLELELEVSPDVVKHNAVRGLVGLRTVRTRHAEFQALAADGEPPREAAG